MAALTMAVLATAAPTVAEGAYYGCIALCLLRRHSISQARSDFAALRAQLLEQAPAQLRLPKRVPFVVSVGDVVLSPARAAAAALVGGRQQGGLQLGGLQQGGGGSFALCIAYGDQRRFGASVELEASDLAVDEIEIELWDGTRSTATPVSMLHPLGMLRPLGMLHPLASCYTPLTCCTHLACCTRSSCQALHPLLSPGRHALPPSGQLLPLPAASARPGPREEHDIR